MIPLCQTCFAAESFCWTHCRNGERFKSWGQFVREQLATSPVTPWVNTSLITPREVTPATAATLVGLSCGTNGVRLGM